MAQLNTKGSLIAGAAAAFGGSLCCVAPLVLLTLGIGARQACAPGTPYADPRTVTRQRLTFWMVALPLLSLVAVPWLAPLFY